jgi:hypothetical protein
MGQFFNSHDVIFDKGSALDVIHHDGQGDESDDSDDSKTSTAEPPSSPAQPAVTSPSPPSTFPLHHSMCQRVPTTAGQAYQDAIHKAQDCLEVKRAARLVVNAPETTSTPGTTMSGPETPTDINLSETMVNLLIADHTHLAICSHSRCDPADPSYDMSLPPATYDEAM